MWKEKQQQYDQALATMQQKLAALEDRQAHEAAKIQAVESTVASDAQHAYVDIDWDNVPDQSKIHLGTQSTVRRLEVVKLLQSIWG